MQKLVTKVKATGSPTKAPVKLKGRQNTLNSNRPTSKSKTQKGPSTSVIAKQGMPINYVPYKGPKGKTFGMKKLASKASELKKARMAEKIGGTVGALGILKAHTSMKDLNKKRHYADLGIAGAAALAAAAKSMYHRRRADDITNKDK